ncbi:alpha/beta hydrolase family protein [Bacillus solitudinis]|uniref:alpha/beta hydrolase family protein n=1 Tax=Bacillus solitudinis TaxID=2014074 RepID=UPI000C24C8E9|nr:alpha/beta hydrolase [Bacillus solitudinis]
MLQQRICIGGEWSLLYLPERPNGFAVFLLSDHSAPVEKETSIWEQHFERKIFLNDLVEKGYTVYTSNLFGKHWGCGKACSLAEQLYHHIQKQQILNPRIHVFAEGMGALIALHLIATKSEIIRSTFLLNPCIYLHSYYEQEKRNRLYYKRFLKEWLQARNETDETLVENACKTADIQLPEVSSPILIMHGTDERRYPLANHSRVLEKQYEKREPQISLRVYGKGKTHSSFSQTVHSYYQENEKEL